MAVDPDPWARFAVRVFRDPAAGDARRVVFEPTDPGRPAGAPAVVVLRAGGDLLVFYTPPDTVCPGLGRDDYLRKAAEAVRAADAGPTPDRVGEPGPAR